MSKKACMLSHILVPGAETIGSDGWMTCFFIEWFFIRNDSSQPFQLFELAFFGLVFNRNKIENGELVSRRIVVHRSSPLTGIGTAIWTCWMHVGRHLGIHWGMQLAWLNVIILWVEKRELYLRANGWAVVGTCTTGDCLDAWLGTRRHAGGYTRVLLDTDFVFLDTWCGTRRHARWNACWTDGDLYWLDALWSAHWLTLLRTVWIDVLNFCWVLNLVVKVTCTHDEEQDGMHCGAHSIGPWIALIQAGRQSGIHCCPHDGP